MSQLFVIRQKTHDKKLHIPEMNTGNTYCGLSITDEHPVVEAITFDSSDICETCDKERVNND